MALTQNLYTGDGSTVLFSFAFPYLSRDEVKVTLDGSPSTDFTFATSTSLEFDTAPANGVKIRIYRDTDIDTSKATFVQGSAIRAADLNTNFTQIRYTSQERENNSVQTDGSNEMLADLDMGEYKIVNLADPEDPQDAVTKQFLEDTFTDGSPKFTQNGSGAVERTWAAKMKDIVSVKDFGATGDGATDDTTAIQAALNYSTSIFNSTNRCIGVYFPSGNYISQGLTVTGKTSMFGDGPESTTITLKPGTGAALITITAVNVAGTSLDDTNHTRIENMCLVGNRTDNTTKTNWHGINCPDAGFSMSTQYSPSLILHNLEIHSFSGEGIFIGDNRNMGFFSKLNVRYNNKSGLRLFGFDTRITDSDFGVNEEYGIYINSGGAVSIHGCNIFYNTLNNIRIAFAYHAIWVTNCSLDFGKEHAVLINHSGYDVHYSFFNCRFHEGGYGGPTNTYAAIHLVDGALATLTVNNCHFEYTTYKFDYLIEASTAARIFADNNAWDPADAPFATDWTASYSNLYLSGTQNTGLAMPAANTVSLRANGVEVLRGTSDGRMLSAGTSSINIGGVESGAQFYGTLGSVAVGRFSNDTGAPQIYLAKSRGASHPTNTTVQNGDTLGGIYFLGADGTDYNYGAYIEALVTGSPSGSNMPSALRFFTAGPTGSPVLRMALKATGSISAVGLPVAADNAAAVTAGLVSGDMYQTATGEVRIVT